jgi:hypothetical protein
MPGRIINHTGSPPCANRVSSTECSKERSPDEHKLQICAGCPRWSADALYEDITGRRVEQTYEWFRLDWIEFGEQYARERMVELAMLSPPAKDEDAPHLRPAMRLLETDLSSARMTNILLIGNYILGTAVAMYLIVLLLNLLLD